MEEIINPSHDVGQSIPIPALAVCLTLCDDHIKAKKSGHDDSSCTQGGEIVKAVRRRITHEPTADTLAELQHVLLSLQDDLVGNDGLDRAAMRWSMRHLGGAWDRDRFHHAHRGALCGNLAKTA